MEFPWGCCSILLRFYGDLDGFHMRHRGWPPGFCVWQKSFWIKYHAYWQKKVSAWQVLLASRFFTCAPEPSKHFAGFVGVGSPSAQPWAAGASWQCWAIGPYLQQCCLQQAFWGEQQGIYSWWYLVLIQCLVSVTLAAVRVGVLEEYST